MPAKLTASINFARVLILVTVAPVRSLPVVVWLTVRRIEVIVPRTLLTVKVGLGIWPF